MQITIQKFSERGAMICDPLVGNGANCKVFFLERLHRKLASCDLDYHRIELLVSSFINV